MSLIQEINKRYIVAMKEKDDNAKAILSIVKNKALLLSIEKQIGKDAVEDKDICSILQKTAKELDDEIQAFEKANRSEQVENLKCQKSLVESFLPKQLSDDEIRAIVEKLEDKKIGSVMKYFQQNYAGMCDMSKVSAIAKSYN